METTIVYWGYIGIMEKMETTIVYWEYIGIMENKMETTIVYWGYIGITENKMETTIVYWGYIGIMENKMETTIVYSSKFLCKRQNKGPCFCMLVEAASMSQYAYASAPAQRFRQQDMKTVCSDSCIYLKSLCRSLVVNPM